MRFAPLFWLTATLGCLLPAARAEQPFSFAATPGQLPKSVVPHHYALHLTPDFTARTTTGTAQIDVEVLTPVRSVVLNALELDVTAAALAAVGEPLGAVTVGFTCGIGVTIFASQIKDIAGLTLQGAEPGPLLPKLAALAAASGSSASEA